MPEAEFLEDLKKELGIPEEEIIKDQLDNPNQIKDESQQPENKQDDKDIQEESQDDPKKDK